MVNSVNNAKSKTGAESSKISIMKRPSTDQENKSNRDIKSAHPVKTLEQRKAEYNEARIRILGTAEPVEDDASKSETKIVSDGATKEASTEERGNSVESDKNAKTSPKAKKKNRNKSGAKNKKKQVTPPDSSAANSSNEEESAKVKSKTNQQKKGSNSSTGNSTSRTNSLEDPNCNAFGAQQLTKQFQNIRFQGPHQKLWTPDQPLKPFRQPFRHPTVPQVRNEAPSFQPHNPYDVPPNFHQHNQYENYTQQQMDCIQQKFDERMGTVSRAEALPIDAPRMMGARRAPLLQPSVPAVFTVRPQGPQNYPRPSYSEVRPGFAPSSTHLMEATGPRQPSLPMPFSFYQSTPPPQMQSKAAPQPPNSDAMKLPTVTAPISFYTQQSQTPLNNFPKGVAAPFHQYFTSTNANISEAPLVFSEANSNPLWPQSYR